MKVKGLVWPGLRTTQFEEMSKLFEDVMGRQRIRDEQEVAGIEIMSRAEVEGYHNPTLVGTSGQATGTQ